jgi:hypothetical protein
MCLTFEVLFNVNWNSGALRIANRLSAEEMGTTTCYRQEMEDTYFWNKHRRVALLSTLAELPDILEFPKYRLPLTT